MHIQNIVYDEDNINKAINPKTVSVVPVVPVFGGIDKKSIWLMTIINEDTIKNVTLRPFLSISIPAKGQNITGIM